MLQAARRILARVSEAYGLMILGEGLFQADGHPGNILVQVRCMAHCRLNLAICSCLERAG